MRTGAVRRASTIGARDAAGERLLAEAPEERGQLVLVEGREELGGRHAAAGVEAHVERPAGPDPEAARVVGQLEAREPEVEQAAVDRPEALLRRDRRQLPEVRLAEPEPVPEPGPEAGADPGDGRPIGVETEEAAIRVGSFEDSLGVAPAAEGRVDVAACRPAARAPRRPRRA